MTVERVLGSALTLPMVYYVISTVTGKLAVVNLGGVANWVRCNYGYQKI
jgi:hypothetical protein